ncbi:sugar phosphate isomerase/epimerase [Saliphagus sp. LR7]|uniref:sugar phosphate isomerase/epimerase family protein n=1 Tax=Saliphagus sp. LR7 TaxID=2282654 RepID=UPI000DF76D79|nr:sugar phosphate isomerase/epimerase family protein [Saliphagus sp. LR7]
MYPNPSVGFVVSHQHSVTEAIPFAGTEGFDHVEIKMHGGANRKRLERSEDELTGLLEAADLSLLVHLPYQLDIGSPHEHVQAGSVRELEACLERAAALGGSKAVVHAESRAWLGDDLAANVLDSIDHLQGYAADLGVELCAENPLRGTIPIGDFDDLFEATAASMTLDTGHARCDGLDSTEIAAFVAEHGERISHVHLNDTHGESDDHLPFGDGTIDFAAIFEAFGDDWDGTVSLEVKTSEFEDIARSRQRLERLLAT